MSSSEFSRLYNSGRYEKPRLFEEHFEAGLLANPLGVQALAESVWKNVFTVAVDNQSGRLSQYHLSIRDGWKPVWDLDVMPQGDRQVEVSTREWVNPMILPESRRYIIDGTGPWLEERARIVGIIQSFAAVYAAHGPQGPTAADDTLQATLEQKYGQPAPTPRERPTASPHPETELEAGD